MKKKVILAAIILVVVAVAVCLLPVYPLYEKEAASYEALRADMEKNGIFAPTEDKLPFTVEKAVYMLEGKTLLAPVAGHSVRGSVEHEGTAVSCELWVASYRKTSDLPKEMTWREFPCVECHALSAGGMVEVLFSHGEQVYHLMANYPSGAPAEVETSLIRYLTDSAAAMQMQAGVPDGSYPVLPGDMTDDWQLTKENGDTVVRAAVPRGGTVYFLTGEEYRRIDGGADPDAVLAARSE